MKIYRVLCVLLLLAISLPVLAVEGERFYTLSLHYKAATKEVGLAETNHFPTVEVGSANQTVDTGTGSQFYARVLDDRGNVLAGEDGSSKFYLGQWSTELYWDGEGTGGSEQRPERDVRVSVPYFARGHRIEIRDAKSNELKLSIDVSRFAEAVTLEEAEKDAEKNNPPKEPMPSATWAFIVLGALGVLALAAYIYKRRSGGEF